MKKCATCGGDVPRGVENSEQRRKRKFCSYVCRGESIIKTKLSSDEVKQQAEQLRLEAIAKRQGRKY